MDSYICSERNGYNIYRNESAKIRLLRKTGNTWLFQKYTKWRTQRERPVSGSYVYSGVDHNYLLCFGAIATCCKLAVCRSHLTEPQYVLGSVSIRARSEFFGSTDDEIVFTRMVNCFLWF